MKALGKLVALGAVLAASSSFAFADAIQLYGGVSIDTNTGSVMFDNSKSAVTYAGSGVLSPFTTSSAVTFENFTYAPTSSGTELVSLVNGADTLNFYMTMEVASSSYNSLTTITSYELQGLGYYNLIANGTTTVLNGTFDITTQGVGSNTTNLSFSDVNVVTPSSVTPEPGSLLLLSTGLMGAAGLVSVRRRKAIGNF